MPPKRRKFLGRLTEAASAARAARASETPEQTSLRLSRMAPSSAARLSTESAAARTERLTSAASTMSARRIRLAFEERLLQNSQDAVRVARLRVSLSPAQKTLRRLRVANAKACARGLESPEKTTSRHLRNIRATAASRASNTLSTASDRALDSSAQTTVRRVRNARSTASARALESSAQITVRRVRNAHSTASAREAENPDVRRQRLENISQLRDSLNGVTSPSASFWSNAAYNYDCTINYSARRDVQIGAMDKVCTFCNAKKWADEQPGLCCSGDKIKLPSLDEPPQPLRDLLLGTTSESTHFLEAIRKYNSCFQMTSFGAKGEPPQFLQIYFLADYNEQVDARLGILPSDISIGPRRDILFHLQDMLHKTNSYIRSLKFALQNNSSPSFGVVIDAERRPHGEHERRFNAPACNEVAAVIHGEEHNSRDIVIRYRGCGLRRISETQRSYDCLQYPHFFFHTEAMCTTSKSQYTRQVAIPCLPQRRPPVGLTTPTCLCGPTCAKGYPRKFITQTQTATDGYPLYRRRSSADGGRTVTVKGNTLDNRSVLPYCPLLSKTFGAHINVEYCHSVKSIKYICKYVYKGSGAAIFGIRRDNCYLSSREDFWQIF
ncbi:unnamed protein product [Acanthosepion pharaonis]|uniref:Uncharacterized protein n=1 Tax=Acanthosepion pharaonis TaxID=158019 RepID=A0A812BHF0_ACAPH|nr:unnamed protein product [Sepia pharaonis]